MAKYRKISVLIWNDAKFTSVSDDAQFLFIMLLTHPHMTSVGAMRGTLEGLAAEKKWTHQRLSKGFAELVEKGMAKFDKDACCIVLPNFIKHNPPENPNVVKSWASAMELVPECDYKNEIYQALSSYINTLPEPFRKAFKTLPKPFRIQEQEQEQEQEQDLEATPLARSADANSEPETGEEASEVFCKIPLVDKSEYPVTESKVSEFQELYPAVDVRKEILKIVGWNRANPKKRKTRKGILNHVNSWLAREQDRGGRHPPPTSCDAEAKGVGKYTENNVIAAQKWLERRQSE
jgi:hypothetical protein